MLDIFSADVLKRREAEVAKEVAAKGASEEEKKDGDKVDDKKKNAGESEFDAKLI